ncbi:MULTISPECIES: hypothetical protein [unclassified Bradyrhizobium]|uniref:hypothetical protein n=1 Tax=unclassified Bradyrhizobium TaxID=2631580 RepID=UPI00247A5956|nr:MULTISPECIES: hypothetical protein [unclassified Bradyrhizobium]WGR68696.1 hypothetical protein MTX24_25095 [Bradyrhizobium sp. ISRA426]WGR80751.1 hypothetical protein MTX21_10210 [Bradyrhizobium sp. ISRA430]WGR83936.1 hypothetical protein MTX25_24775 [Bradyrhizobium sp. ISRA432]
MKRLMLSLVAGLLVISAATSMLRSHGLSRFAQSGMPDIQELQRGRASTLPEQKIEDRSVVFAKERTQ